MSSLSAPTSALFEVELCLDDFLGNYRIFWIRLYNLWSVRFGRGIYNLSNKPTGQISAKSNNTKWWAIRLLRYARYVYIHKTVLENAYLLWVNNVDFHICNWGLLACKNRTYITFLADTLFESSKLSIVEKTKFYIIWFLIVPHHLMLII